MATTEITDLELLRENAQQGASLLKVMSNEWRLLILCHLATGERSVGELEEILGIGQSALSQHLAILRREKLVKTRRNAQSVFYALDSDDVEAIMGTLYECFCKTE